MLALQAFQDRAVKASALVNGREDMMRGVTDAWQVGGEVDG